MSNGDAAVILAGPDSEDSVSAFALAQQHASHSDSYLRSSSALALGRLGLRECYNLLMKLILDKEDKVSDDAIIGMGNTGDSRVLFPLMNFYDGAKYEKKVKILTALQQLRDPRCVGFLDHVITDETDPVLQDIARDARGASYDNTNFVYRFAGPEHLLERALQKPPVHTIGSSADLDALAETIQRNLEESPSKPQTYIVLPDHTLWVGGDIHEHVLVAHGEKVLAAGEVVFIKKENRWTIPSINNRSNGYYPGANTFTHIRRSLCDAQVHMPSDFTHTYPLQGYDSPDFLQHQPLYQHHRP